MKQLQFITIFLLSWNFFGQEVSYNYIVEPTDRATKEVMALFENYIVSNRQDKKINPYWNLKEQEQHESFDFLESEFEPSLYMGFPVHVLSLRFVGEECFIKVQFSSCRDNGIPNVLAIVNYIAKKENGKYKLYNFLTRSKKKWNTTTVGQVQFYYPKYHQFNKEKAQKLNEFIGAICENFEIEPKPFEYYLADDYEEIQKLKGIDYYLGMGGKSIPRGKAGDDKVYCGGLGEYYTHEVCHVQVNKHFPNLHFWVSEGIATLLGGSRGKSLQWHIAKTHTYIQKHPEIDFNNMLQLVNLDSITSYHYVLGGLIIKKIVEKGGYRLLKEFMSEAKNDEQYYKMIEKYLKVRQSELNAYIRNQLAIEARK